MKAARLRRALVLGVALGACGVVCSLSPAVLYLDETVGLETLFAVRGTVRPPADVAVISISRDSAGAVGQTSELDEWPRTLHADLIDAVTAAGAAAIVFDVAFDKPRNDADDERLAAAIAGAGNVILLERVESENVGEGEDFAGVVEQRVPPIPPLESGALATAPFVLPVVPIRLGQFWTFGRAASDTPSLPVVALQAYLGSAAGELGTVIGDDSPKAAAALRQVAQHPPHVLARLMRTIRGEFRRDPSLAERVAARLDARGGPANRALRVLVDLYAGRDSRYLNYYGPPRTIRTIPYDEALHHATELDLAGKVLFVGFSERRQPEQKDWFYSVFSQSTGANLSGVEIGATAFANLLEGRALEPLAMPLHLLLVLSFGVLLGVTLGTLPTARAFALAVVAAAAYACWTYWRFSTAAVWWPLVVPLGLEVPLAFGAAVLLNYRDLALQRTRVQLALGHYVPGALVEQLAEQSVSLDANRQLLHGTCLVTDAEEYTAVAESLSPEQLRALLNEYYEVLFEVVARHGGVVSDAAGDSMVAIWASAKPAAAARGQACRAALEIATAVDAFNRRRDDRRLPTRIGLESGQLMVGNIGAERRFEYRAIGDIVNTAARIQGLNRELGTKVLVSGSTLEGADGIEARDLGAFLLRGKKLPVRVFAPCANGTANGDLEERFAAALGAFERCEWPVARRLFAALAARYPDDGPAIFYAHLSADYERRPPASWAGAIVITSK